MHASTLPAAAPAEETDTVRCTCCGLHKPLVSGAVIDHRPTRTATTDCPGSGARRRTGAERGEDARTWAQALATGNWGQILGALQTKADADARRPPALPDPAPAKPEPFDVEEFAARSVAAAIAAHDQQLSLFDRTAAVRPADRPERRARRRRRTPAEILGTDAKWAILHVRRGSGMFAIPDDLLPRPTPEETAAAEVEGAVHFDLTQPRDTREDLAPPAVGRPVVVIPCSAGKRPLPDGVDELPAAQLYTGPYFAKCLAAAQAIPGGRVVIVSAAYGLITPDTPIRPYEKRLDPRNVDHAKHRAQAAAMGQALRHAPEVIALAGTDYADAAAAVWPHLLRPLAEAGIGTQLQRLTRIAASDDPRAAALDYAAQATAAR
ncbi:DUF6884 domain-containing protein [Streptomyces sp. NBC_01601]|uniref:DUF6884 domain-containing protein n=1 Tax=Streptomyces sp. NBC_01601 TaxID=2975892 RepID=UPI002E2A6511|nr:DUF6884 domain-containing protein [Streptomyces sp. NBC_01601]